MSISDSNNEEPTSNFDIVKEMLDKIYALRIGNFLTQQNKEIVGAAFGSLLIASFNADQALKGGK